MRSYFRPYNLTCQLLSIWSEMLLLTTWTGVSRPHNSLGKKESESTIGLSTWFLIALASYLLGWIIARAAELSADGIGASLAIRCFIFVRAIRQLMDTDSREGLISCLNRNKLVLENHKKMWNETWYYKDFYYFHCFRFRTGVWSVWSRTTDVLYYVEIQMININPKYYGGNV